MLSQGVPSYCNRYKILIPNAQILMLRNNLRPVSEQNYQLAKQSDIAIRKYHRCCQNIEKLLPTAQWRFQAIDQVAHWYYIQLGRPKLGERTMQFQVYTEHIDLLLKDMNNLITVESLYILTNSLRGYRELLLKFQTVSINSESIGLNCMGSCIVWLNRQLQSMNPEIETINDERQIIKCLINLIKQKSQFTSKSILSKILDFSLKNNCNIKDILSYIDNLMSINRLKLAVNLKYLVNRNKIFISLKYIQSTKECQTKIARQNGNYKGPLQLIKGNKSTQKCSSSISKYQRIKHRKNLKTQDNVIMTSDQAINSQNWPKTINKQSRSFVRMLSSKQSDSQKSQIKPRYSLYNNNLKRSYFNCSCQSKSKDRNSQSRSPDKYNTYIINKLKNLGSNKQIQNRFMYSQRQVRLNNLKISQTQTASSLLDNDKCLGRNSSLSKLQNKTKTVYKSFINKFNYDFGKEQVHEDQKESCESSPQKDNNLNQLGVNKQYLRSLERSLEVSFGMSNEKKNELILQGNNWTKTLQGLMSIDVAMNSSIVEGPQRNDYLSDVKLQKLDLLGRNMAQSLMPSSQLTLPVQLAS